MEGYLLLLLALIFGPAIVGVAALMPWRRPRQPDFAGVRVDSRGRHEVEMFSTGPRWWWPFGSIYAHGNDGRSVVEYRRRLVPWWRFRQERRTAYRLTSEWSRGLRGDLGQEGETDAESVD